MIWIRFKIQIFKLYEMLHKRIQFSCRRSSGAPSGRDCSHASVSMADFVSHFKNKELVSGIFNKDSLNCCKLKFIFIFCSKIVLFYFEKKKLAILHHNSVSFCFWFRKCRPCSGHCSINFIISLNHLNHYKVKSRQIFRRRLFVLHKEMLHSFCKSAWALPSLKYLVMNNSLNQSLANIQEKRKLKRQHVYFLKQSLQRFLRFFFAY